MQSHLRILQINTSDDGGGAERLAYNLHRAYRERGCHAVMAVRSKRTQDLFVKEIPNDACRGAWARFWLRLGKSRALGTTGGAGVVQRAARWIGQPRRAINIFRGFEDFDFPGTRHVLNLFPEEPQIVQCHNLHGAYFDLRALHSLCKHVPVVLTLHDTWFLSGHCAYSFECERWRSGCGNCPDLTIYPRVKRDATAYNWSRKRAIYARSRLYVASICHWTMRKVERSMLASGLAGARVIPNGVDLSVFRPADKNEIRSSLGLLDNTWMLLFAAKSVSRNIFKDYRTVENAFVGLVDRLEGKRMLLVVLGEDAPTKRIGDAEIRYISIPKEGLSSYYQAADVYMHAARADTFPNSVLEALACGTPVVATAVGGIPEQVRSLKQGSGKAMWDGYDSDEATGILVPPGSARIMTDALVRVLTDERLRVRLGENALADARKRFDLKLQANSYLEWFSEILHATDL